MQLYDRELPAFKESQGDKAGRCSGKEGHDRGLHRWATACYSESYLRNLIKSSGLNKNKEDVFYFLSL